jgi:hypothetical protein
VLVVRLAADFLPHQLQREGCDTLPAKGRDEVLLQVGQQGHQGALQGKVTAVVHGGE